MSSKEVATHASSDTRSKPLGTRTKEERGFPEQKG